MIDDLRLIQRYQNGISKLINLLDWTPNQPSKFLTKNSVHINDDSHETYNTNSDFKFKISMLKLSWYKSSDA